MRVPIHDQIWARPFITKGLLFLGWTVSPPHVLSSEVSVSFLNRANRSGKYPGSEAVCHFHPEGPISGKGCERQLEEVYCVSKPAGGLAVSVTEILLT